MSAGTLSRRADEVAGPTLTITSSSPSTQLSSSPKDDALLVATVFQVALAEASYRMRKATAPQYAETVSTLFSSLMQGSYATEQQVAQASAYADALIDIAGAVSEISSDYEIQWQALSQAQNLLTELCSPANTIYLLPSRLANIYVTRADIDITRFTISLIDGAKAAWQSSRNVLIANSGVYYRGAKNYAERAKMAQLAKSANARSVVAEILRKASETPGDVVVRKASWEEQKSEVSRALEQMITEKLLGRREAEEVMRVLAE